MRITVMGAHFIKQDCCLQGCVHRAARVSISKASVRFQALDALCKKDAYYRNGRENLVWANVFNHIYPQCTEEDKRILRASLNKCAVARDFRSKVVLNVEPCMKVGALKSLLKAKPWTPHENLVLVRISMLDNSDPEYLPRTSLFDNSIAEAEPLEDDRSTLRDCGIKSGDILLACMSGSFPYTIVDLDEEPCKKSVLPISSCFETVGDLKKRIHKITGKDPDGWRLFYQFRTISLIDSTPLIAYGIVRQYLNVPVRLETIEMML